MFRLLVIGIDGLDPILLKSWIEILPNIRKLIENDSEIRIKSTFPPDSICAWTSIFTGKNPAEHGIIDSIDYLDSKKFNNLQIDQNAIYGNTFWDELGEKGKKVIIINPFLAYPAWPVNGIMISGPVFEGGDISIYPNTIKNKYYFPKIGGIVDFPAKKEFHKFINDNIKNTRSLAETSLYILQNHVWEFAFISFLTLDRVKHFFWRYHDENDPTHPRHNPYKEVIKNFYIEYDRTIGEYIKLLDKDTKIMIISDHGHRIRCTKCFNINEYLRRKQYLVTKSKENVLSIKYIIEKTKVLTLKVIDSLGLHDITFKLVRLIPNRKELKKTSYLIDKKNSIALTGELCSTNPYGGIEINKKIIGEEYEKIRKKIITDIQKYTKYENIFKWIKKREDVYQGKYQNKYPDILFEFNEEYGVSWNLFCDLVTKNITHKKISGGHKNEATFIVYPKDDESKNEVKSILDIKKYIIKKFS